MVVRAAVDVCKVGKDDAMPWQVMGQWKKMAAEAELP